MMMMRYIFQKKIKVYGISKMAIFKMIIKYLSKDFNLNETPFKWNIENV